jgi:hypothetical protein
MRVQGEDFLPELFRIETLHIMVLKADVELRKQGVVSFDASARSTAGLPCTQFHLSGPAEAFLFPADA